MIPARGGRSVPYLIVPAENVYAPFPPCTICTWICVGPQKMRLKFVNASCALHQGLPLVPA